MSSRRLWVCFCGDVKGGRELSAYSIKGGQLLISDYIRVELRGSARLFTVIRLLAFSFGGTLEDRHDTWIKVT